MTVVAAAVVGATVVGFTVVGAAVVGLTVVGAAVVGFAVVGLAVVGFAVVGLAVVGLAVVGVAVVGAAVVGTVVPWELILAGSFDPTQAASCRHSNKQSSKQVMRFMGISPYPSGQAGSFLLLFLSYHSFPVLATTANIFLR